MQYAGIIMNTNITSKKARAPCLGQEHTALFLRWQEPIEGKLAFVNSTGSVEVGHIEHL